MTKEIVSLNDTETTLFSSEEEFLDSIVEMQNELSQQPSYGIDCPMCKNKAVIYFRQDTALVAKPCECHIQRKLMQELTRSGYKRMYDRAFLDTFKTDNEFQVVMLNRALKYLGKYPKWLYIGGQVGSGKTHIALAILRELIKDGKVTSVQLMNWRQDSTELKQIVFDDAYSYNRRTKRLKESELLLIDDFIKGEYTQADLKLAFDLINYRYMENLPTIITSEKLIHEVTEIDEAIGSRIEELATTILINRDKERNVRL